MIQNQHNIISQCLSTIWLLFFFLTLSITTTRSDKTSPLTEQVPDNAIRFVAGSCIFQDAEIQPLWQYMLDYNPDFVLLLGDNIYLDSSPTDECEQDEIADALDLSCFNAWYDDETWYKNLSTVIEQYDVLLEHQDFALMDENNNEQMSNTPSLLIWDDHDYGKDNEDFIFKYKNITKNGFIYFWEELNSIAKDEQIDDIIDMLDSNDGMGVFYYYDINKEISMTPSSSSMNGGNYQGYAGSSSDDSSSSDDDSSTTDDSDNENSYNNSMNKNSSTQTFTVRVYAMDSRWYSGKYNISDEPSMLGIIQRTWLEGLLSENNRNETDSIDFHIFMCGLNMLTHLNIGVTGTERWTDNDKEWFLKLLQQNNMTHKSLLLSGDIHYSIINSVDNGKNGHFFELVTSSMTHSIGDIGSLPTEIITDDDYSRINVIYDNNFMVLDIMPDMWQVLYVGHNGEDDRDELRKNEILYAEYNYNVDKWNGGVNGDNNNNNARSFNSVILDEDSVADEVDKWYDWKDWAWWGFLIFAIIVCCLCVCCVFVIKKLCCAVYKKVSTSED